MNIDGFYNVIQACIHSYVKRLVYFSSIEAIDRDANPKSLDGTFQPAKEVRHSPYACSKAFGEELLGEMIKGGFDAVILNPTSIISPYDYKIGKAAQAALDICRGRLPVLVDGRVDWVDARDAAVAAMQAALHAPPGSKFILSGHQIRIQQLAETLGKVYEVHIPGIYLPLGLVRMFMPLATLYFNWMGKEPLITEVSLSAMEGNWKISHARASQKLGYSPRSFEETIRDCIAWHEQVGYLPARNNDDDQ